MAAARQMLIADAMRKGDDVLLRHLLAGQRKETMEEREKATPVSAFLKLKAQQSMEQAAKRRKERQEEDRRAANDAEEQKRATARAQQEASEARRVFFSNSSPTAPTKTGVG